MNILETEISNFDTIYKIQYLSRDNKTNSNLIDFLQKKKILEKEKNIIMKRLKEYSNIMKY